MGNFWGRVFRDKLSRTDRGIINELIEVRNKHSHYRVSINDKADSPTQNEPFSDKEAERALCSMKILMERIDASDEATEIKKMRRTILERCLAEEDAHAKADGQSVTESKPLTLIKVETDVLYGKTFCTVLHFKDGNPKRMKTATFDKDRSITEKAKSLVGKRVITTCWDPKDQPGLWTNQGYFKNIYEV